MTSYARLTSGLEDQQTLSTYHELLREGRTATAPTAEARNALIDDCQSRVRNDMALTEARRESIWNRLEAARTAPMDGRTYYAATRLLTRTARGREAFDGYVTNAARDLGVSETEIRQRLNRSMEQARTDRTLRADRTWQQNFGARTENSGLPLDRQTAYAIQNLEADRAVHVATRPTRPTVTRHRVQSRAVHEVGYDPQTGHLEVVMNSNPGRVYHYRVPTEVHAEMMAGSIGSYFARNIRGNEEFRYDSTEDAQAAATQTNCATCGQFSGPQHACPTRDSAEERNRTARRATRAARAAQPGSPAAEQAEPVRMARLQRGYRGESGMFRAPSLTDVQQTARRNPQAGVSMPIAAAVERVAGPDGAVRVPSSVVSGRVTVTYNGRGRGYTATAVSEPGDSGTDQLRCQCEEYRRNYDCVHLRQTLQDINTRLNQTSLRDRHAIGESVEQVSADLAVDRAESVAAQENARNRWTTSPVSYTDDMRAFQADYKATKDRIAAGEPAIPYMTQNALDGLGDRNGGRGFGVEFEFDINPGTDRYAALQAIGRDLSAAGLTRSARQEGYHAARRRGYSSEHQGGWSFEQDGTVAGEIVSPIMYDEPETWENIAKVCEIVKRHGGTATIRTGAHVHVSTHNYDHTVANYNRLMATFAENEDLIYRLSSNPATGQHRGRQWCAPNRVPSGGYASVNDVNWQNSSHGYGINMESVSGNAERDNVEFRTWDATLDPSVIQVQIKTSLAMTEAAFRDTDVHPTGHEPLGSHRSHNRAEHGASRRLTGQAWEQDTAGFRQFADRLFRRPEDKAQITALFAVTRWQRGTR